MEVFNECTNYLVTCMMVNIGQITDGKTAYDHGLYINTIIISMYGVNLVFVMLAIARSVRLYCLGLFTKRRTKRVNKENLERIKTLRRQLTLNKLAESASASETDTESLKQSYYSDKSEQEDSGRWKNTEEPHSGNK